MKRESFQYNGITYEIYGRAEHLSICNQPHIFDVEAKKKPHSQMEILKGYLFSNDFTETDLLGNTHQLISKVKKHVMGSIKPQSISQPTCVLEKNKSKDTKLQKILDNFFAYVVKNNIEIYNEFSLQHELGIYLRDILGSNYKVQFERNVRYFGIHTTSKHEIDIAIFNDQEKLAAIELKHPKNGQYPEQMFKFIQDIKFMEEVKNGGFQETYAITLVQDHNFYEGSIFGIYEYFRSNKIIEGTIVGPTKMSDGQIIHLDGQYEIEWKKMDDHFKYYIVSR